MSIQRAERELEELQRNVLRLEQQLNSSRDRLTKVAHYIEMAREFGESGPRGLYDASAKK